MARKNKFMGVTATQELINLIKADFAKKQGILQFLELPPAAQHVGRVYEYVGETTLHYTKGHFYKSTGFDWYEVYPSLGGRTWQYVTVLPAYDDADFVTLYAVADEDNDTFSVYIKSETAPTFLSIADKSFTVTCYDDDTGQLVLHYVPVSTAEFSAVTDEEIIHFMETV